MLCILQASNYNESIKNRLFKYVEDKSTVLDYLCKRLSDESEIRIVISTSDMKLDDEICKFAEKRGIKIYRGEYNNVLQRLYDIAKGEKEPDFVRINANCPLVDIDAIKKLFETHVRINAEYSYNENLYGMIWGCGAEIFHTETLARLLNCSLSKNACESIGLYLRQNESKYRIFKWKRNKIRSNYKVCIETYKDLEVVCELIAHLDDITEEKIILYLDNHKLTAQHNMDEPPRENGIEKLFYNQEKVDNILKRRLPDMTYPISVELTLTNKCNLNCVYCSDMDLRKRQGMTEMISLETLKKLFDDLASGGTRGVVIEGGGEPTLFDKFKEAVLYARKVGLAVGLITNGTSSMDKKLLESFEWIRVSLDASTPDEYRNLKGVDYFERVLDNISCYAKYCDVVGVGYVVTNNNISQIESLILRLRMMGVSYIQCRPVVDNPELYPKDVDLSSLRYYSSGKFGVMVDGMVENAESGNGGNPCYAHSITTVISGDGSVYICGRLNIYDWLKPIGNINQDSFRRIWYGDERQNQAELLIDAEFCKKNCPQCRISKFNTLFTKIQNIKTKNFI